MARNYDEQNRNLIEKTLEQTIKQIFIRMKLGLADWDVDATLRGVLQEPSRLKEIQDLVKKYDETFDLSIKSNTQLNEKYKSLYNLNNNSR